MYIPKVDRIDTQNVCPVSDGGGRCDALREVSGFRNFIFWPYQALPGLTGLDERRPVTREGLQGCIVTWLHGKRVNWVGGLIRYSQMTHET